MTLSVFDLKYSYERRVVPFAELHPFMGTGRATRGPFQFTIPITWQQQLFEVN